MKELSVSNGKWKALVDDEDFEYLNTFKWWGIQSTSDKNYVRVCCNLKKDVSVIGRVREKFRLRKFKKYDKPYMIHERKMYLHDLVIHYSGEMEVDHINGNPLDNRKCNLRLANSRQQKWNQKKRKNNRSGYKGVVWHVANKKWQARIKVYGKEVSLKFSNDPEICAIAYDEAAKKYFGEFKRLNFPEVV